MADPVAVNDADGEWVEIYNPNEYAVALDGWQLVTSRQHLKLPETLTIPGDSYCVIARSDNTLANGGVLVQAVLDLQLANEAGALTLVAPDGVEVDSVTWSLAEAGRSLERLGDGTTWRTAVSSWSGSAGDWGSPGAPSPPAPPPPEPTLPPPTPPPLPDMWPLPDPGAPASPVQIDEVAYRGSDDEYVVLVNTSTQMVDLAGWQLGDAAHPGDGEAMAFLPEVARIPPGGAYVIARSAAGFAARWFAPPDVQFEATGAGVPALVQNPAYPGGNFALDDTGDEVVLLSPEGVLADAVCFGDGDCAALALTGRLDAPEGVTLQRVAGPDAAIAQDVRERWALLPAAPFAPHAAPAAAPHAPVRLPGGMLALWGELNAASTYSAGGTLPPRALLAEAAARGLDFVALSDADVHAPLVNVPITLLPAWSWEAEGESAVIYGASRPDAHTWQPGLADRAALLPWLHQTGIPVLWRKGASPTLAEVPGLVATATGSAFSPDDAVSFLREWRSAGGPLLPLGPYTGLLAGSATPDALLEALAARRGWLSTAPELWLALSAGPEPVWMGSSVAPANDLQFTLHAGDQGGAPLHVTLWQDESAVATADVAGGAPWSLTLLAPPGAFFYATAVRADGAFAVSAPLHVALPQPENARDAIRIVEVLPRPTQDWNGDGNADANDEYVRLVNRSAQPVALAGWQIFDSRAAKDGGLRFTCGAAHVIPAQGELVLWRSETHIVLNDGADHLYLFLPGGGLGDEVFWQDAEADIVFTRTGDATRLAPVQDSASLAVVAEAWVPTAPSVVDDQGVADARLASVADSRAASSLAGGDAATVATAREWGINVEATVRGVVILPPGLLHSTLYVAQIADDADGAEDATGRCGTGLRIFLPRGDFPPVSLGDEVVVRGQLTTFRGERELRIGAPDDLVVVGSGTLPQPFAAQPATIGEALEGRLVAFTGRVAWADGDSLYLSDTTQPNAPPVRVLVARSLGWPRPPALPGQLWRVTGVVSQMARVAPWNGGYRVLVRWPADLELVDE